jgi:glycosyltransferase involved in cell wall biosynthesis
VRLLWISDSPASPSGFGAVTRAVCSRLAARGHAVEILGWQQQGRMQRWEGIPVHPVRHDAFGADAVLGYLMRQRPDFVITLADVWWMSFLADPPVQRFLDQSRARWVLYYPIDGADPDGTLPGGWRMVLDAADVPVAMSRFGQEVTRACGIEAAYVPHGVDLDVFRPPADRAEAKAKARCRDRFVVLSDARNQPRKLLPRTLDVFARFAAGKPDALLHLHCDPDDDAARSPLYHYDLRADIAALGLGADQVRITHGFRMRTGRGLDPHELAALYQAADVHLLSSWGEGFGLPTLQAAAAGVVPMAVDATASAELVRDHGVGVPVESTMVDEFGLVRHLLDRDAAAAALDLLYREPPLLAEASRRSRAFAEAGFGWDTVVDLWERVLAEAPPRRPPARTRSFGWVLGEDEPSAMTELPAPVREATSGALADLPDGVRFGFQVTERAYGEVAGEIRRGAFEQGSYLSIPVCLAPAFEDGPRPRVGNVMASAGDLVLAVRLKRLFPGLALSLPQANGDPAAPVPLPFADLVRAVAQCILVLDVSRTGPAELGAACAALGVPYLGPSPLWAPVGEEDAFADARRLLTDQGHSEARRALALERALAAYGPDAVATLRAAASAAREAVAA